MCTGLISAKNEVLMGLKVQVRTTRHCCAISVVASCHSKHQPQVMCLEEKFDGGSMVCVCVGKWHACEHYYWCTDNRRMNDELVESNKQSQYLAR